MKFRLCEKFTSEIFYQRKYPDLRYIYIYIGVGNIEMPIIPCLKIMVITNVEYCVCNKLQ